MGSLKTISEGLKLIDSKKESLKKAFDDLQTHSSLLSSFSLTWSDLDCHFTSFHNTLIEKFRVLESLESQRVPIQEIQEKQDELVNSISPRPELRDFCLNMDGKGLRNYIISLPKDQVIDRLELVGAIICAEDPAMMVLDALDGFYNTNMNCKGDRDRDLCYLRRTCVLLLETLVDSNPSISLDVRERARNLALEWKANLSTNGEKPLEGLGFLELVATYGLKSEFDSVELIEYITVIAIARYGQATKLCKTIGLGNQVADLVQKLISKSKQLLAVKFIFEFELTEKFPPVPLLKEYVKESSEIAKNVCKKGNYSLQSLNEATSKEVSALRSVIKIIENHNLGSEYSQVNLEKRIEMLEKKKVERKRPASGALGKAKKQKFEQAKSQGQRQSGQKLTGMTSALGSIVTPIVIAGGNSLVSPYQPPRHHSAGSLSIHHSPYESLSAVPYGMVGSAPSMTSYPGSSARLYGFSKGHVGSSGNVSTANAHLYPKEPYVQSGYYDRPAGYDSYGMPPTYHPSYYSQ